MEKKVQILRDAIAAIFGKGNVGEIDAPLMAKLSDEIEGGAEMNPGGIPLGLSLYAGRSGAPGLFVDDGNICAAVKSYIRPRDGNECIHIVAPTGKEQTFVQKLNAMGDAVKGLGTYKDSYVRYITQRQRGMLVSGGRWDYVNNDNGWIKDCPHEDEQYPQVLTRLPVQLSYNSSENVRKISNRLKSRDLVFKWRQLDDPELAIKVITKHFSNLGKEKEVIGSCALDYELLCRDAAKLQGRKSVFALMGYLNDEPVSVFICQQYKPCEVAVFGSITLRERGTLQNLPLYVFMELFTHLRDKGINTVNLLGCETESLFKYKLKFGEAVEGSTWAIHR